MSCVVVQFLEFLYQQLREVETFCSTQVFLAALSATLFPLEEEKELNDFNVEVRKECDDVTIVKF